MTIRRPLSVMIAATWLALATPVAADCDMTRSVDDALADGSVVFVGDVASLDGSDATFAVREVWSGDVGPAVTVHGFSDEGQFGEDDRTWTLGATYLVVPHLDRGVLRDNICTPSTSWDASLMELRPADARVVAQAAPPAGPPLVVVGMLIAALIGISWFAFRRRFS